MFRSSTQHSSLCANGLSASLRLGVQLRGDSLISHLAVLFLSCRVIMPEVDVWVRNGPLFKGRLPWTLLKKQSTFAVCPRMNSVLTVTVLAFHLTYDTLTKGFWINKLNNLYTIFFTTVYQLHLDLLYSTPSLGTLSYFKFEIHHIIITPYFWWFKSQWGFLRWFHLAKYLAQNTSGRRVKMKICGGGTLSYIGNMVDTALPSAGKN